jgi:DNA-binding beta-propeller fold protein YncE
VQVSPSSPHAFVANAMDDHLSVIDLNTFEIKPFAKVARPNGILFLSQKE